MKLFHGTTAENYEKIINEGFQEKPDSTWVCSGYGDVYFYSFDKVKENNEYEYEDDESFLMDCIHMACGNAFVTAALDNSTEPYVVILEFDIPKKYVKHIDNDTSCQGMSDAVCVRNEIANKFNITKIHKMKYHPMLRFFYLKNVSENKLLNREKLAAQEYELIYNCSYPEDLIYEHESIE